MDLITLSLPLRTHQPPRGDPFDRQSEWQLGRTGLRQIPEQRARAAAGGFVPHWNSDPGERNFKILHGLDEELASGRIAN